VKSKLINKKNQQNKRSKEWINKKWNKIKKRRNKRHKNNKRIRKQINKSKASKMMIYSLLFFETDKYV
jgi:hypothetical protein